MALDQIDTIIFVMLENRSFDHVLGYLALPPFNRGNVEGLRTGLSNDFGGATFPIFHLENPEAELPGDPPHERRDIGIQLNGPLPGPIGLPPYPMNGFIVSYAAVNHVNPGDQPCVMGYFDADDLPAANYLAQQFCICDHWFCSLPAGTQPNRLMAHSGYSRIEVNQPIALPKQDLVYDWLDAKKVRWRVYHEGIPFFILMDDWHLRVLVDDHFKDYDDFLKDWMGEGEATSPQVIFIEPRYTDAPHVEPPSDDHAPSPIANGQRFLSRVFGDIQTNPDRWAKTLLVVTYDEHGGFFDHVSPVAVRTEAPDGKAYPAFESTGPRVPAFLVSPFVEPGSVFRGTLDHTSFLKLLGKKFNGGSYSAAVDARLVGDLSEALTLTSPRKNLAPSPLRRSRPGAARPVGFTPGKPPRDKIPQAFQDAVTKAIAGRPNDVARKFPELFSDFGFRR